MEYKKIKALIMGLGLHGGGLESARFLLKRGADVTVTDLRDEKTLMPSIKKLDSICHELGRQPVRYILGKHEIEDFKKADIVIKNPGVRPDSPFLQVSKRIETDLSLFLSESPARLFSVTGTKGKSCTSSALHWILSKDRKAGKAYLGGNITVSPLTFLDELTKDDDVVLELSSFQLGDIKNHVNASGQLLLKPAAAILTAIMHDHLDRYNSMDEYIDDKRNIYRGQDENCITVIGNDDWGKSFHAETKGRSLIWSDSPLNEGQSGGWIDNSSGCGFARLYNWNFPETDKITELVPQFLLTPGKHQRLNMLAAALAAYGLGLEAQVIRGALYEFPGIEHRLEFFHEFQAVRFYNDSAATIPEAAAACIEALTEQAPLVIVTGGTDKNLDFSPLASAAKKAKAVILLKGSGSEKLVVLLNQAGIEYSGPFDDLDKAVLSAISKAASGDNVVLSPGCASFGMFLNEFDRGNKWKNSVLKHT
ncbi:MAG: UDP-N-acetylmuramoyl-L-alanine--D-glutamate ligase [Treponema sp.]|nr:UDP-N-acetylmuramoyl-L-alanine--D-glutamate ligase [Treponema sp.]